MRRSCEANEISEVPSRAREKPFSDEFVDAILIVPHP